MLLLLLIHWAGNWRYDVYVPLIISPPGNIITISISPHLPVAYRFVFRLTVAILLLYEKNRYNYYILNPYHLCFITYISVNTQRRNNTSFRFLYIDSLLQRLNPLALLWAAARRQHRVEKNIANAMMKVAVRLVLTLYVPTLRWYRRQKPLAM